MTDSSTGGVDGTALGAALGILWAAAVVGIGLAAREGWGAEWRDLLADGYRGYDSTDRGLAVGAAWAFADGFAAAYLTAWLYNRLRG